MAKRFLLEKEKWNLKLSVDKRKTRSSTRRVVIQIPRSSFDDGKNSENWYEDLVKFIGESKKEVASQANRTIKSIKEWQHKSHERLDMIQQYVDRGYNLQIEPQNITTEQSNPRVEQPVQVTVQQAVQQPLQKRIVQKQVEHQVKRPVKHQAKDSHQGKDSHQSKVKPQIKHTVVQPVKVVQQYEQRVEQQYEQPQPSSSLSMPVLDEVTDNEDDFGTFLETPLPNVPPKPKKIERRRYTTTSMRGNDPEIGSSMIPFRKQVRSPHSSVAALKLKSESSNSESKQAENESNLAPTNEQLTKSSVYLKFLETQKLVLERKKQHEFAYLNMKTNVDTNMAYPDPKL